MYHGLECVVLGHNTITNITSNCLPQSPCGTGNLPLCCDRYINNTFSIINETLIMLISCDGSLPYISAVPALWAIIMYMTANILYNVFLVLVIKYQILLYLIYNSSRKRERREWKKKRNLKVKRYGSAALMYIASTLVLPMGSISFTIRAFLGHNTQKFTVYLFYHSLLHMTLIISSFSGAGLGVVLLGLIIYRWVFLLVIILIHNN